MNSDQKIVGNSFQPIGVLITGNGIHQSFRRKVTVDVIGQIGNLQLPRILWCGVERAQIYGYNLGKWVGTMIFYWWMSRQMFRGSLCNIQNLQKEIYCTVNFESVITKTSKLWQIGQISKILFQKTPIVSLLLKILTICVRWRCFGKCNVHHGLLLLLNVQ